MKPRFYLVLLAAYVLSFASVSAQPQPPGPLTEEERAARHAEFLERFDTDGDGVLSPEELKAARQAMAQSRQPGRPGLPGRNAPLSPEMRRELLERFDTDGDGVLSSEERAAARKYMLEQRQRAGHWNEPGGEGVLSPEERRAAREKLGRPDAAFPALPPEERQRILEKFDADGDGVLSPEERAAAREYLMKNRPPQVRQPGARPGESKSRPGQPKPKG